MSRTLLVLLTAMLHFHLNLQAQQKGYEAFVQYNSENGLPQNSITGIAQDKKGFVWISTSSGLARFDGHRFRVFNMVNYYSSASNRLNHLFTYRGRLFAQETWLDSLFEIVDENTIRMVKRDRIVALWKMNIAYYIGKGLALYKKKHGVASMLDFITDSTGNEGYCRDSSTQLVKYYRYPEEPVLLPVLSWRGLDHSFILNSRLYSIDQFTRLVCFEKGKQIAAKGSLSELIGRTDSSFLKLCHFYQSDSNVFFTSGRSIYKVIESAPGKAEARLISGLAPQADITAYLFLPGQQTFFIGTGNNGLYMYRQRQFDVLQVPQTLPAVYDRSANLVRPNNTFYPVAELNDSTILTSWGGLTFGRKVIPSDKIIFSRQNIPIPRPGFFIGFKPGGQEEPYLSDHQLQNLGLFDHERKPALFYQAVQEADTVYMRAKLSMQGKPVVIKYLFRPPHRFIPVDEYPDPDQETYCIAKPPGDTLWIGTGLGVYAVHLSSKKIHELNGLSHTVIRALYSDRSNKLWIGTYGKGWYLLEKGKLRKLFVDRNRNLEYVHAFLEDEKGYMWVSTNNGLFRFYKADLEKTEAPGDPVFYNYFTREYGFNTNEFNGGSTPAALRMSNGKFVFPGMNGLVVFDPLKVPVEQPSPHILTGEYMLNGKPVETLEGLTLPANFNNISLKVFIPYFGQKYNLQLEYRLSSGANTWTRLPENGLISFNRLTHGNYILTLRMLKGFGTGGYLTKEISFTVAPRWYQTNLFYISCILLMAALSGLYIRWRTRKIKQQKAELEKEVELRTNALKISEEKIRQNAQFKSQVTSLVLHDVRSPLYYLNKITENIYRSTEGKVPDGIREELKDLHLSVKDISAYAQTLFAWISAQQDNFILRPVRINIAELLNEICANYQLLAAQNNNTIAYLADQKLTVVTQADLLQIVTRNLVDNAIKFTNNGKIVLSAGHKSGDFFITVTDTGKGMTASRVERILGNEVEEIADTRSGMGYRLIRDLLKKMDGRLAVESEPGKGSAVTIILPG